MLQLIYMFDPFTDFQYKLKAFSFFENERGRSVLTNLLKLLG